MRNAILSILAAVSIQGHRGVAHATPLSDRYVVCEMVNVGFVAFPDHRLWGFVPVSVGDGTGLDYKAVDVHYSDCDAWRGLEVV